MTFQVDNSNCMNGDGLQLALFDNCNDPDALICNPGNSGSGGVPVELTYDFFVVGKTYYLMLDGWGGDVCDFELNVTQGNPAAPGVANAEIPQGPSQVCPGMTTTYHINPVDGAGFLHWIAPPGSSINGGSNNVFLPANFGETVTVHFGSAAGNLCVMSGNSCQLQTQTACLPISMTSNIPPTVLPPLNLAFSDLPYHWPINGSTLTNAGTFTLTATLTAASGCDSLVTQQVTVGQPQDGYATGVVFWDANANGVLDFGEMPFTTGAVVETSSGQFASTDSDGKYVFQNLQAGDTIRLNIPQPGLNALPNHYIKVFGVWDGYNFGLNPAPLDYDLSVFLNSTPLRAGFHSTINLVCHNSGPSNVPNPVITATLPFNNLLSLVQFSPANADVTVNGNTLTWLPGDLTANSSKSLTIEVAVSLGFPLGTPAVLKASAEPISDDHNPVNNFDVRNMVLVGALDPNDKQVTPAFVTPALISNGQPFEYTIRFQNTGNYPAEFVRIVDSLGSQVDPGAFRFIAASHPCTWKISGNGVLEFMFEHINLPDSASNEMASHGFVRFSVQPRKNLSLGTVIRNFCDIYFDFNPPVRTNTAGTQVVYFLPGAGLAVRDELIVRPNPAAFFVFCDWQTPAPVNGRIRLFDLTGLSRLEVTVAEGQNAVPINVQSLSPGLYYVVLEAGNLVLSNKLIVVQPGILGGN